MGNEQSADLHSSTLDSESKSKGLFRRSSTLPSKMKAPKLKTLSDFQYAASYLSLRVQNFNGVRHDQQYEEIEKQVVQVSMELQNYRASLLRDADRIAADGVQKSISDCLAALLRKAQENESGGGLDGDAVESRSFVAQSLPKENSSLVDRRTESSFQSQQSLHEQQRKKKEHKSSKNRQSVGKVPAKYQRRMQTLYQIEKAVLELKTNVTNAIFCQQIDSFDKYENKIKSICRDLELVDVEEHSPLSEKKKELYDLLIKCNNNIKKARRRMERQVAVDIPDYILARSEMDSLEEDIHRTEELLQNEDEYYGDLKAKFEELLGKVAAVKENAELQERKKIATDVIRSNLSKIRFAEIRKRLSHLKTQIDGFDDVKYSDAFVKLDQQLRQLWDEVSTIEDSEERKLKVIGEIQTAIQSLLKKSEDNSRATVTLPLRSSGTSTHVEPTPVNETVTSQNHKEIANQMPVYQNNELYQQEERQNQQLGAINKSPLPTPREEPSKQKQLEEIIDDFIQQWHNLKLHAETNKWNHVEKARIKIKLANIVSNIQDIFDNIERQEQIVVKEEHKQEVQTVQKQTPERINKREENRQSNPVYSKPILHVKPETSKPLKEVEAVKIFAEQPSESNNTTTETERVDIRDTGERISANTIYFNFTAKPNSTSERFGEMRAVVDDLRAKVAGFNEAIRNVEYERVKSSIDHCVIELKSFQPKGKALLEEVYELAEQLEIKVAENQSKSIQTRAKLKELVEKLQGLKKKIDNFTGTYKNVLYTKIEEDLKCLIDDFNKLNAHGDKKLMYAIQQTKQKAQQYLKILESKSAKPEDVQETLSQKRASSLSFENVQRVREKLFEIKDAAENFKGFTSDPSYKLLQKELSLCAKELNEIQDHGRSSLQESKRQYLDYIEEMHKYLEQKAQYREDEDFVVRPIVTEKSDTYKQLEQIEESFSITARKVEDFRGKPTDKLYAYLDEMLIMTLIALDNLDIKDDEIARRKGYLSSKVHQFSKLLGEKAKARKFEEEQPTLDKIRRICNSIKFEIDCRSEIDDNTYSELNERLVNLLIKVDGVTEEEEAAKQNCKEYISEVLRILQGKINYQIKFIADLDGIQI